VNEVLPRREEDEFGNRKQLKVSRLEDRRSEARKQWYIIPGYSVLILYFIGLLFYFYSGEFQPSIPFVVLVEIGVVSFVILGFVAMFSHRRRR
jgi:RsiW-degrading membrane proteinase PrsW (M82 family)